MTLDELAIKHGTDKSSQRHGYCRTYEKYLEHRRSLPMRVLEIGCQFGNSHRMWLDYFPNGFVTSLDVIDNHVDLSPEHKSRSSILILDATKADKIPTMPLLDLIVDDGSHHPGDISAAFYAWWFRLAPGGLYCIEDTHATYHKDFGGSSSSGSEHAVFRDWLIRRLDWMGDCSLFNRNEPTRQLDQWESTLAFVHFYRALIIVGKQNDAKSVAK